MDVTTFDALFSATCFTLLGLWWGVVQRHEDWMRDDSLRGLVGGVYVSFLLPALMGPVRAGRRHRDAWDLAGQLRRRRGDRRRLDDPAASFPTARRRRAGSADAPPVAGRGDLPPGRRRGRRPGAIGSASGRG